MSDNEDDFVTFGNALEPLDEENLPRKKPVTVEEQFAYDAQGRRRFHGAFTGGFSAGYFNTVGTRDGWRPQQFKSTRASKAGNVVQRPEDFMDEEDTGEFGIAPTAIRATQDYSDQANKGTKREHAKDSTGPIPGTPVLKDILKPVKERVGVTLLKKMGWKPGQGVGPRLTKQQKKQQKQRREKIKIYGCALPNQQEKDSESESEDSDEYADITFAPDDYEPYRCNPKDNYFGIGYSGLDRRPILGQHINLFDPPAFSIQDKNKKLSIKGQAFGVGAFEAEDDDIYHREDMSRYDFALGPEKKKSRWSKEEKQKKDCIEGFILCKEPLTQKKIFPAPALPKDFQPVHKVKKSRFSPLVTDKSHSKPQRYEMNAESRAKIINDDRPSIIDSTKGENKNISVAAKLITRTLNLHGMEQTADREKLEKEQTKKKSMSWLDKLSTTTFVKGEIIGSDSKIKDRQDLNSSKESEKSAEITSKRPSFADLDKQRRFEQYLTFTEAEKKYKLTSLQPLSMTEWERDQEADEFEKVAKLCSRIDDKTEKAEEEKKELETKVNLESLSLHERMTAAAKLKMFGKLTRTDVEWKPAKLVCVRFNIAEPFVGVAEEGKPKKKFSIFDSLTWNEMAKFEKGKNLDYECDPRPSTSYENEKPVVERPERKSSTELRKQEFVEETPKSKKMNKPEESTATANLNPQEKKDLFKSIFLSSSEESESENEQSKDIDEEKWKAALIGNSAAEQNTQRNTSPPRGIFAKLDLDSITKRPDKMENKVEKQIIEKMEVDEVKAIPSDVYGPALPTAPLPAPPTSESALPKPSKDEVWIEKSNKKKSKKEKKKHKHKERSKSKSRKKSKKDKKH
ncbi:G patch domain-containing protein 1 homolog [Phymastichus coffea]|uniref:G patch domain-containing protein 1 homolog n=1 Tax=Phymastichus coffea TaxID=108790 RepID=UPI00273BFB13|nr:G patch domain-containing protein 1 homolog [Phymastichus coffea]